MIAPKYKKAPLNSIKPSPENDDLYGAVATDAELLNLAKSIRKQGLLEPIKISKDNYIISGHRRFAAARLCGLKEVPVITLDLQRADHDALAWKQILRAHNHQRVKSAHVRLKEALLDVDPELAHIQLIAEREKRDRRLPPRIEIDGELIRATISERKQEMLECAIKVVDDLIDFWPLSVRQVHYGMLNYLPLRNSSQGKQRRRYANNLESYKDLCDLLTRARLKGLIDFGALSDETRPVSGVNYPIDVAEFVARENRWYLSGYRRNLLQSQPDHIELIVEKMTVQGIIEPVAEKYTVPMTCGRGYCSITPRYEIVERFKKSGKDRLVLLIAADFDPDGEEIAESLARSIRDDFGVSSVVATKILLRHDQVSEWGLPENTVEAKVSSCQFKAFSQKYGTKVYELEAIEPLKMQEAVAEAIEASIDLEAFNGELAQEREDAATLQAMKAVVTKALQDN